MQSFSFLISGLALLLSLLTAWLTLFRRGQLKMTPPAVVYFGADGRILGSGKSPPKLYLRTLLFSTGKKGRMIESMHAKIARNETVQNFNIWVYGEDRLVRGSGLFVGEEGVSTSHHFLAPKDGHNFSFVEGRYRVELYAKLLEDDAPRRLWSQEFDVSADHAQALISIDAGLYFDWAPNSQSYMPHIEERPPRPDPTEALRLLLPTEGPKEEEKG